MTEKSKYVTILECAIAEGAKPNKDGSFSGAEIERVGYAIVGGCADCGASIACFNGYPSRDGWWRCRECIEDSGLGYTSTELFLHDNPPDLLEAVN